MSAWTRLRAHLRLEVARRRLMAPMLVAALPVLGVLLLTPRLAALAYVALLALLPPLAAGAAASLWVGDPTLELLYVTPTPGWRIMLGRHAIGLAAYGLAAVLVAISVELRFGGALLATRPPWAVFAPMLAASALAATLALWSRQAAVGAGAIGILWIGQVLAAHALLTHLWGQRLLWVLAVYGVPRGELLANAITLIMAAVAIGICASWLARCEARYF
jgi:hypothetical protein